MHCLIRLHQALPQEVSAYQVGVISMYRGQVDAISRAIERNQLLCDGKLDLQIGTVDSFQGRPKDGIRGFGEHPDAPSVRPEDAWANSR